MTRKKSVATATIHLIDARLAYWRALLEYTVATQHVRPKATAIIDRQCTDWY